ncbi:55 kDa erythrocyte membrane protein isoform X4 [Hydra vulgaris]|uniref:55 kDa erythrocyte membrane protein isoform X4 n=1 Tax=Hydra vulgaris TaxID=6087 RepID=A0ABM4B7K8_HYDVU
MLPSYLKLENEISRGSFYTTKRCINTLTGEEYAVKVVNLKPSICSILEDIKREILICKQLCHPNIVQTIGSYQTSDQFYIITELITGSDICSEILNKVDSGYLYSEAVASFYMRQILEGLEFIHECQVVHRNLNPLCMMLASTNNNAPVKITDFRFALKMPEENIYIERKAVVPSEFTAPEVAHGKNYNYSVDIWGFGVILYILLNGESILQSSQINSKHNLQMSLTGSDISETAKDILYQVLEYDPVKRPSATSLLQHQWFNKKQQAPRLHLLKTIENLKNFSKRQQELYNCQQNYISETDLTNPNIPISEEKNKPVSVIDDTLVTMLKIHNMTKKYKDENDVNKLIANASLLRSEVCLSLSSVSNKETVINERVTLLLDLLDSLHFKTMLKVHDDTIKELQQLDRPIQNRLGDGIRQSLSDNFTQVRLIQFHRPHSEPLGITVKMINKKHCVARIIYGGMIHRHGTLNIGDEIKEVNGTNLSYKSVEMVQKILNNAVGDVSLKVVPSIRNEEINQNELYVRCLFDYDSSLDNLIPCQQAGMSFECGEILEIKCKSDPLWWQATKPGKHMAGLIPSQELQEWRIMSIDAQKKNEKTRKLSLPSSKKKPKQKQMAYRVSLHTIYDKLDLTTYEEVAFKESFSRKVIVLIGAKGVNCKSIKNNLIAQFPEKFSSPIICTTSESHLQETDEKFLFVNEKEMLADINQHKYLNYFQSKGYLYGITLNSIHRIISDGLIPILDVEIPVLKLLRCKEFSPCVIFVSFLEFYSTSGDAVLGSDMQRLTVESADMLKRYRHLFDHTVIYSSTEKTVDQIMNFIAIKQKSPDWIPVGWLY